jgi:hypothetical protein
MSNSASAAPNTSANYDDCRNCYFNLCKYDGTKTFQGVVYKAINYDEGTFYYNCDNGIVTRKRIIVNQYGTTTNIQTDTILMSNAPLGTKWSENIIDASAFGIISKEHSYYSLIAKKINTTVKDKTYNDVIVVNFRGNGYDNLTNESVFISINYYYAKGVGLIRTDTLNFDSDPVAAINKSNDTKTVYSGGSVVKDGIDMTLVGVWKYHDPKTNVDSYYKFLSDGTFEFYSGSVSEANKSKGVNHWKIEEGGYNKNGVAIIDITWGGGNWTQRDYLLKKNDPASGKAAFTLNDLLFVSADNKSPWKLN